MFAPIHTFDIMKNNFLKNVLSYKKYQKHLILMTDNSVYWLRSTESVNMYNALEYFLLSLKYVQCPWIFFAVTKIPSQRRQHTVKKILLLTQLSVKVMCGHSLSSISTLVSCNSSLGECHMLPVYIYNIPSILYKRLIFSILH